MVQSRQPRTISLGVTTAEKISDPIALLTAAMTATSCGVGAVPKTKTVRFVIVRRKAGRRRVQSGQPRTIGLGVTTAEKISDPIALLTAAMTATSSGVVIVPKTETVRFVIVKSKQGNHTYIVTCMIGVNRKLGNLHHNEPFRIAQ